MFKQTFLVGKTSLAIDDVLKLLKDNEKMTKGVISQSDEIVLAIKSVERGRSRSSDDSQGRNKSRPSKRI